MDIPIRILIADDDEVCSRLIRDAIEDEGVEVTLAGDGMDALDQLKQDPADILITDLHMPRMDGLTLLTHARQLLPHLLSIIITGYGSLESAVEAIHKGAYDYVQKPFSIERISVVTRNAVGLIRISREKARLLSELEGAYRKLQLIESRSTAGRSNGAEPRQEDGSQRPHFLSPHQPLPLYYFEAPKDPSASILSRLERLAELKRQGVLNESELSMLKKAVIHHLGS